MSNNTPMIVDDLSFTTRLPSGCIKWWNIEEPETNLWEERLDIGRGYALELLALIDNTESDDVVSDGDLGAVMAGMVASGVNPYDGIVQGFFEAISERLTTGSAKR